MEIRNILTFLKVAGTQNFSKAAEQLGPAETIWIISRTPPARMALPTGR